MFFVIITVYEHQRFKCEFIASAGSMESCVGVVLYAACYIYICVCVCVCVFDVV